MKKVPDNEPSKLSIKAANTEPNASKHLVKEPATAVYASNPSIIGAHLQKPEWRMTAIEKMTMIRSGLNKNNLESLKSKAKLDYNTLSALLSTTKATLINRKGNEVFNASLSEKILSLADIYSYGFQVFESETKFNSWINKSNQSLGGNAPIDLLDNQFGREEVRNLLGRIEYGVYS